MSETGKERLTPSSDDDPVPTYSSDDESVKQSCWTLFTDPSRLGHRLFALVFMCFLAFGSYFCYDGPGALQDNIEKDMAVSTAGFSSLYAWYSWPNTILCFFGGFLIDRVFGIRLGAIIFSSIIIVGQVIFAFGGIVNRFWLMQLGRFVFGVGGESLAVAQNTYAVSWFKGKELNMVFGLQLSISRLGSMANFMSMPYIYKALPEKYEGHTRLGFTLLLAAAMCVFSTVCALVLGVLDKRAERILNRKAAQTGEVVHLTDIKDFPGSFWVLCFICVSYYVAIFPFIGLGKALFLKKYNFPEFEASSVDSVPYLISAIASPIFGIVVDYTGMNLMWVCVSVVVTVGCHALLAFSFVNPWLPMVMMGLAYSLLACGFWSAVALCIPEHQLGTAYGMVQSVQNLGLAVVSLVAGVLADKLGYLFLEVFFLIWLAACVLAIVGLMVHDRRHGGVLNRLRRKTE
ncbi:major facilitator superfamily domain-containing protein 1-like [Ornithodoros turicata]|uniref:major facilitator superfamily domain-containing protein 1-like n=1 Tax=Ornithodoros turicata TaxID=34597 RepID=UPI003139E292